MSSFTDMLGQTFEFDKAPSRIVSLVPSQTELLYELGLEDQIVGITKFCVHPFHFKSVKTIVGGTKKVRYDKIAALEPDIIICNKEENTEEMVAELRHIAPVWVTDISDLEDNYQMIRDFGQLFNRRTEARKWEDKLRFAEREFTAYMDGKPQRKAAYFIWKEPWMVAGAGTFIDHMMKRNRFVNIYHDKGRYPEVVVPRIRLEGDPELVLLSSEPYPFKDEDAFEIGRRTHHAKTVFVDGEMFSWYGTRPLRAFAYFRQLQHRLDEPAYDVTKGD